MNLIITPITQKHIQIDIDIHASDKSMSHRVCMLALFADNTCRVSHFLHAEDTLRSLKIAESLGLTYTLSDNNDLLLTPPKNGLQTPHDVLYCGNSGTTMRLFSGLLAGANIYAVLCGDIYLHARPMGRIINPLKEIGANIVAREVLTKKGSSQVAPLSIIPTNHSLLGFTYHSPLSSAQVKSAMILAGLQSQEVSQYTESSLSRNHTENMLQTFQNHNYIHIKNDVIIITPFHAFDKQKPPLKGFEIQIPNDPSSAFFFAVLASITPNSCITLKRVMINKTRIEAFRILEKMGASISYENKKTDCESSADITIQYASLNAVEITENIAWLIDEIPALSIACSMAKGVSKIRNAGELRVKESDRIAVVLEGLRQFGIETQEYEDGFDIIGGELHYAKVDSKGDHRIAMSFAIAACVCGGEIQDCECIQTSFPNFVNILQKFTQVVYSS